LAATRPIEAPTARLSTQPHLSPCVVFGAGDGAPLIGRVRGNARARPSIAVHGANHHISRFSDPRKQVHDGTEAGEKILQGWSKRIARNIDGMLHEAPIIKAEISTDSLPIRDDFTEQQAEEFARKSTPR
jgi:hypothetical protein